MKATNDVTWERIIKTVIAINMSMIVLIALTYVL